MARIAGIDLPKDKRIEIGLTYIYGIGRKSAKDILAQTGVNPDTRVKDLSDADEQKLRDAIDSYTVEGDLRRQTALDIKRLTEIGCYRGIRHRKGLPVRGQMRKKKSEYGIQLNEKQKVKFIYGILEKQFHAYYEAAAKTPGKTGDNLLIAVERRLDNVVYRMGFAMTRRQARQLVSHAHFTVNGRKVDIPSYQVKAGDVIEVAESSRSSEIFKRLLGQDAPVFLIPAWMEREKNALKGTVTRLPAREDIDVPVEEHLIVELYSK